MNRRRATFWFLISVLAVSVFGCLFLVYKDYQLFYRSFGLEKDLTQKSYEEIYQRAKKYSWVLPVAKVILFFDDEKQRVITQAQKMLDSKELVDQLLGMDQEKTYLVVFQNNTELRPSGGFWGAYGILKIKEAKIVSFETANSYALDLENKGKYDPPAEVVEYFEDEWRFYSSNWSPDFALSVKQGLEFFAEARPDQQIDGVFGPNIDFLLPLLEIIGPVQVPDHNFSIDQNNFLQKMVYEPVDPAVYKDRADDPNFITSEKKVLLGEFGMEVINTLIKQSKFKEFAWQSYLALERGDLAIYYPNTKMQNEVRDMGWSGSMDKKNQNYLMIVDANLGSKLDFVIDKKAKIEQLSGNKYRATITYKNNYSEDNGRQAFSIYRNLVRLFLPKNSVLVDFSGGYLEPGKYDDAQTDSTFYNNLVIIEPGGEQTISFVWESPYNSELFVQKQLGSHLEYY